MSITRTTGALIGVSETSGDSIANNATDTGAEVDVLGNNTSVAEIVLYLVATSTVVNGSLDVTINYRRLTGQAYAQAGPQFSLAPISGTLMYKLGRFPASRYMQASIKNNATGASATNVSLLYELFQGT